MEFTSKHPLRDMSIEEIRNAIYKAKKVNDTDLLFDHLLKSTQLGNDIPSVQARTVAAPMHSFHQSYDDTYALKMNAAAADTTKFAEAKIMHKEPHQFLGGVLGYTILGDGVMVLREDLFGELKNEVELHEAIHTNDEYETRRLTDWMLSKEPNSYSQKIQMFHQKPDY